MSHDEVAATEGLLAFIGESPSMFHTCAAIRRRLDAAGFTYLPEGDAWTVEPGGAYYTPAQQFERDRLPRGGARACQGRALSFSAHRGARRLAHI